MGQGGNCPATRNFCDEAKRTPASKDEVVDLLVLQPAFQCVIRLGYTGPEGLLAAVDVISKSTHIINNQRHRTILNS